MAVNMSLVFMQHKEVFMCHNVAAEFGKSE